MYFLINKKIIDALLIVLLAVSIFVASLFFPFTVKAVVPVQEQPGALLAADMSTAESTEKLEIKEVSGIPILSDRWMWATVDIAIEKVTRSTVDWINSGFQGNPAYVTDLRGFLLDLADEETSLFIEGTALEALCSPWKLDIKIALALPQGQFEREVACTLSDIVANMDDFINGDFSQGGWAGWFELTTKPQNNPYGLYLMTASELEQRIAGTQQEQTQLLSFGNGFFSQTKCEELPPGFVGPPRCKIVNPGVVIEEQLNNILFSGQRRLEVADEFNEILSALLGQLFKQILGAGGLRSLSEGSQGRPSFTSRLGNVGRDVLQNTKDEFSNEIDAKIQNETDYRNIKQSTLNAVVASENLLFKLQACYAEKLGGDLNSNDKATAQQRINNAASTIDDKITITKAILENNIVLSNQNLVALATIRNDVVNSTTLEQLEAPGESFSALLQSGELNESNISLFTAQQEQSTITAQMSALDATTNTQIAECQAFPPPLQQNP